MALLTCNQFSAKFFPTTAMSNVSKTPAVCVCVVRKNHGAFAGRSLVFVIVILHDSYKDTIYISFVDMIYIYITMYAYIYGPVLLVTPPDQIMVHGRALYLYSMVSYRIVSYSIV